MSDDVPAWALRRIRHKRRRWEARERAFRARLPTTYPEARARQEWLAYKHLRETWTRPEIRRFVEAHEAGTPLFPGVLDAPGYPSLTEFKRHVELLAEGRYARTLSVPEMLTMLATDDAARTWMHGEQLRERARTANRVRQAERVPEHEQWRKIADGVWRERPDLSKSAVARLVKQRTGTDSSERTIRRKLARPT